MKVIELIAHVRQISLPLGFQSLPYRSAVLLCEKGMAERLICPLCSKKLLHRRALFIMLDHMIKSKVQCFYFLLSLSFGHDKADNLLVIHWSTLRYKVFPMYIQSLSIYTKSLMVTSNEFVSKYLCGLLLVVYKLTKHTQMGISIRDLFAQITWSEKSHPKCGRCHLVAVQIKRTSKEERKKFAIGMFSFTLAVKFIYPVTSEILNWYES